ncbi:Histone deacetylase 6 [Fasciola gigantica]|uniref:Histone deacetylase 6 n=1 Tax=Fasciola gigantica TaxID=46835 RepID=A0A504YSR8_FASGI|nr:Histone deacetylase 6 [Fasciola gigantica]
MFIHESFLISKFCFSIHTIVPCWPLALFCRSWTKFVPDRIAIVDWDVHHGNGTKKVFEENPNILFISVHRFDDGRFFPNSSDGSPNVCGVGEGVGRTIQVAWNGRHVRDGEYIAVFTHLVLPVLYEFRPQLILVSAGFDATRGDRLGGLNLSVECFAHLTHMLLSVAYLNPCSQQRTSSADSNPESSTRVTRARQQEDMRANFSGGLILALEGGYHLATTAEAICHSVASLLGDCCPRLSVALAPSERQVDSFLLLSCKAIRKTLSVQEKYWKQIQGFGPLRSLLVCDDPNRINSPNRSRVGSYPAMALTGQLEAEIQSRLEELSLSDVPAPHATTLNHLSNTNTTRPVSTNSASIFTPDPVGLTSLSNSVATTSVTARQTDLGSPITLTQVPDQPNGPGGGTDYSMTHATGTNEQIGSISMEAHSSSTTLVGPSTLPPNVDELAHLRRQSDRSSLASELSPNPHFRFTTENTAGLSGSSDAPSTTVPLSDSVGNPVVAVATLQDLMDLGNISTEDIHAFFGLRSTQQLPQRLFAVTPLPWCPHLASIQTNPDWSPNVNETCGRCENELENWVCLNCYAVYCGRYANSHMLEHFSSMRHPLVLSFADLSSWCYECEAYVHNEPFLVIPVRHCFPILFVRLFPSGTMIGLVRVELTNPRLIPTKLLKACASETTAPFYAVTPITSCPHVTQIAVRSDWTPNVHSTCSSCTQTEEIWVCLLCHETGCGRYAQAHMLEHYKTTGHPIALSFADLSTWCYQCESYIKSPVLNELQRIVHRAKFGEDPPQMP